MLQKPGYGFKKEPPPEASESLELLRSRRGQQQPLLQRAGGDCVGKDFVGILNVGIYIYIHYIPTYIHTYMHTYIHTYI